MNLKRVTDNHQTVTCSKSAFIRRPDQFSHAEFKAPIRLRKSAPNIYSYIKEIRYLPVTGRLGYLERRRSIWSHLGWFT